MKDKTKSNDMWDPLCIADICAVDENGLKIEEPIYFHIFQYTVLSC